MGAAQRLNFYGWTKNQLFKILVSSKQQHQSWKFPAHQHHQNLNFPRHQQSFSTSIRTLISCIPLSKEQCGHSHGTSNQGNPQVCGRPCCQVGPSSNDLGLSLWLSPPSPSTAASHCMESFVGCTRNSRNRLRLGGLQTQWWGQQWRIDRREQLKEETISTVVSAEWWRGLGLGRGLLAEMIQLFCLPCLAAFLCV